MTLLACLAGVSARGHLCRPRLGSGLVLDGDGAGSLARGASVLLEDSVVFSPLFLMICWVRTRDHWQDELPSACTAERGVMAP